MEATGERFLPDKMNGIIKAEHLNRYYFVTCQFNLKDKTVLDIASGEGYGSNILAQYAKNVYGVDIDEEAVTHAKSKYNADNLHYMHGSATNIPMDNNTVDIVVSFETIEHHNKHEEMMSEIKRVLKPNGMLIMSSPNKKEYTDIPKINNHFHVKELYTDEFVNLLSRHFTNTKLFWQRFITGSIVLPVNIQFNCNKPINLIDGIPQSYGSVYDIIIATDNNGEFNIPYFATIYPLNVRKEIINPLERKYYSVLNSHAFKLGCFLLRPIYWIKRIWNKGK